MTFTPESEVWFLTVCLLQSPPLVAIGGTAVWFSVLMLHLQEVTGIDRCDYLPFKIKVYSENDVMKKLIPASKMEDAVKWLVVHGIFHWSTDILWSAPYGAGNVWMYGVEILLEKTHRCENVCQLK